MAFTRHQIEKRRLIELVKLNPILWDCRLPHYKRSDKKKALKWNELGRIFSVNGERVQRTFTSLREIFRRELNHEKMLGSRFKSKWEYYDEMAFLKEVIRERKSRERAKSNDVMPPSLNTTNTNTSTGIDEYQYFAPNDPNNPQNQSTTPPLATTTAPILPSVQPLPVNTPTPTTQNGSCTPLLPPINPSNLPLPMTTMATTQLQPDVLLNFTPNTLAALQKLNASSGNTFSTQSSLPQQQQQHPSRPLSRARSLTIRSCSSSPSIYIKDEPDSLEDTISLDTTSNGKIKDSHKTQNQKTRDISSKLLLNSKNLNSSTQNLVIDERDCSDLDDDPDDDVDMLDDRLSISTSLQSVNKNIPNAGVGNNNHHSTSRSQQQLQHNLYLKPTAREILYTKFGEFLAARLNTLNETVANELMNKILMLIAEK